VRIAQHGEDAPSTGSRYLMVGTIRLDRSAQIAYRRDRALRLTPADFRLLEFLLLNRGKVFSRRQLLIRLTDDPNHLPREIYINVQIRRIREELNRGDNADPIRTVRSYGFAFDESYAHDRPVRKREHRRTWVPHRP
jgi:two-component system, OmpR family, phosphate regulon response regulator PhoB